MTNEPITFTVTLVRVSDGVSRDVPGYGVWSDDPDDDPLFWWTDGNGACDCNRAALFASANGEADPEQPCDETAYVATFANLSDGRRIPIDKPLE